MQDGLGSVRAMTDPNGAWFDPTSPLRLYPLMAHVRCGVQVKELVVAGGLPDKNALLRQIYADFTG